MKYRRIPGNPVPYLYREENGAMNGKKSVMHWYEWLRRCDFRTMLV